MFKCVEECQDRLLATRLLSLKSFHNIENNYGMTKVLGMKLHIGGCLDTKHGLEFFLFSVQNTTNVRIQKL